MQKILLIAVTLLYAGLFPQSQAQKIDEVKCKYKNVKV